MEELQSDRVETKSVQWWEKRAPTVNLRRDWEAYLLGFMKDNEKKIRDAQFDGDFETLDKTLNYYSHLGCDESITKAVWDLVEQDSEGDKYDKALAMAYLISKVMVCTQPGHDPMELVPDSLPDELRRDFRFGRLVPYESFEESKEEHDRSLQAWLKNEWICDAKDVSTEVVLLGKTESMPKWQQSDWFPYLRQLDCAYHSYPSWMASEEEWKQSDDASALRICVMIEPANTNDETEKAYRIAKQRGMMVLLVRKHGGLLSMFMDTRLESESDAILFDDSSDASIQARVMCEQTETVDRSKDFALTKSISNTIRLLRTGMVNDEVGDFFRDLGVFGFKKWNQIEIGEAPIRGENSLLHLFFDILANRDGTKLFFGKSLEMLISPKLDSILMITEMEYQSKDGEWFPEPNSFLIKLDPGQSITIERDYVSGKDAMIEAQKPPNMRCTVNYHDRPEDHSSDTLTFEEFLGCFNESMRNSLVKWEMMNHWFHAKPLIAEDAAIATILPRKPIVSLMSEIILEHFYSEEHFARFSGMIAELLRKYPERVANCGQHWVSWMDEWAFGSQKDRFKAFKTGLLSVGIKNKEQPSEDEAWKWAKSTGDPRLIRAFKAYEKSLNASSTTEEKMASDHSRWATQSGEFVKRYILDEHGKKGEECVKVLMDGLMKAIQQRADFTAVDLVGLVWHSSKENRESLSRKLMMAMQTTLDYDTVHKDKVGWHWAREVVLKHPLWLCEDVLLSGEDEKKGDESGPKPILFDRLLKQVNSEVESKGGSEISRKMQALMEKHPESWRELCEYKPKKTTGILRQDCIEQGPKSSLSRDQMNTLKMQTNTLDMNIEKEYDTKAFLTEALTNAYLVSPNFNRLMGQALSALGTVQFGPVKQASRVEPKSEEYANEGRKWPHSACVIDLVRCSVTVNDLSEMVQACRGLESFIDDQKDGSLSICRCKNGFSKFDSKRIPDSYTDVKFNVACKSEDGKRAIIGEVQILLKCILDAKLKAHELYEVTRSKPLYSGAKSRFDEDFSFSQQLLLTGGNERLLVGPIMETPFLFSLDHIDFAFLFRADFKSSFVIHDLAKAIVDESNSDRKTDILPAMLDCFSQFSDGRSCFGQGSGSLMTAIIQRVQPDLDLTLFFNDRIIALMKEHLLDMGLCFNLFTDLPHSDIKSKIKWDDCLVIETYDHLPRNLDIIVKIYQGFSDVKSFDRFMKDRSPEWYDEFDHDDHSVMIETLQTCFDCLKPKDYQFVERVQQEWIELIVHLETQLASYLLRSNPLSSTEALSTKGCNSLNELCDFLDTVPHSIRFPFLCCDESFQFYENYYLDYFKGTAKEIVKFQQHNPTVHMFDRWINRNFDSTLGGFFADSSRLLFPEIYLVSSMKKERIFTPVSKNQQSEPESMAQFFGDERSEECRSMMVVQSVIHFLNRVCEGGMQYQKDRELIEKKIDVSDSEAWNRQYRWDAMIPASEAAPFILRLLPNKEWPFWSAMLQSGDILDESTLGLLKEVQMPEVNKSGSVEDYREWQQRVKSVRYLSDYLRKYEWPLHSAMGVIGDSMRVLQAVIDAYQRTGDLDPSHLDLAMLLRADWESEEVAAHMAGFVCESLKIGSAKEMSDLLIQHIDGWPNYIWFGHGTGLLIAQMFRQVSQDDWIAQCAAFIDSFLSETDQFKLRFSGILGLLVSLPDSVLDGVSSVAISRIQPDQKIRVSPKSIENTKNVMGKIKDSLCKRVLVNLPVQLLALSEVFLNIVGIQRTEMFEVSNWLFGMFDDSDLTLIDWKNVSRFLLEETLESIELDPEWKALSLRINRILEIME